MPNEYEVESQALGIANEIIDYIDEIEEIAKLPETKSEFAERRLVRAAICWRLHTITAAMKATPAQIRFAYPAIPWGEFFDLTELAIGGRLTEGSDLLNDVVEEVLPKLKEKFRTMARCYG